MLLLGRRLRAAATPAASAASLLALVGFGFSAYLTYLELFVIDAICQWCVASAVLMTILLRRSTPPAPIGYVGAELRDPTPLSRRLSERRLGST